MQKHLLISKVIGRIAPVARLILWLLLISLVVGCVSEGGKLGDRRSAVAALPVARPMTPTNVRNIALLLPLTGNLAVSSKMVRNGFLAAYYAHRARAGSTNSVNIKVIDTSGRNVVDIYREVVAAGAEVVVGPLTKQEVEAIVVAMGKVLPVPTLALNTLSDYQRNPVVNLYQFGLLPQDESQQAAIKMLQDGQRNVAVVMPNSLWGRSVVAAFHSELVKHGGRVVATLEYGAQDDFDLLVQKFLQVDSYAVRQSKTPVYARSDINALFLVADANIGRQIVPLLRFYSGGKLPLYAISNIYRGFVRSDLDQDLNDVIFCDVPWAITHAADLEPSLQEVRYKINTLWPDSQKGNIRLYALGVDAYNLSTALNKFLTAPKVGFNGATGQLILDDYNHIYRQLRWTVIKNGIPQGL